MRTADRYPTLDGVMERWHAELSNRAMNTLVRNFAFRLPSAREISAMSDDDLGKLRNLGAVTLREIREAIAIWGGVRDADSDGLLAWVQAYGINHTSYHARLAAEARR